MMNNYNPQVDEAMKYVGDTMSIGTLVAYFSGSLPVLATILTIIWTALRIYEMETVQRWLRKKNEPQI